jgi:thiol:disulfide interchange protein/DsbC/DsbD-like thiol-disulfide interchange protein
MPRFRKLVALAFAWLAVLAIVPVHAAPTHIAAKLIAEGPGAPGGTVTLALAMQPEPGWHGYWQNPGDAGIEITLDWVLPRGAKAGAAQYPVPETLLISGLMNHVYEHDYAVLIPLTLPADAAPGARLPVRLKAKWLACTDKICVPEQDELETEIVVGAKAAGDPRFDAWRQALPAPLGSPARFALSAGHIRLAIPLPAAQRVENPHLFFFADRLIEYAGNQSFSREGDLLVAEVPRTKFEPQTPGEIVAVLRLNPAGDGVTITATPGAVPQLGVPIGGKAGAAQVALGPLLLLALAGGLLLNIMPCVFPILSLKALSLARAGESEAQARSEGLAYTAGVVLACLALGGLLLGLRAAGQEVGWAFQLQEPLVVAGLLLLAVAITANLLGLFEFAVPGFASEGSPQGAFATGLLAAFAATPCTGPFMAAAMGAALLLPVAPALALFAALGLGLALPFLALAWLPALRRRLPRPGAWMVTFRRWMALPMGLTALALLWLASRIGGTAFAIAGGALALGLVALLAQLGDAQRKGRSGARWLLAGLAGLLAVAALVLPGRIAEPSAAGRSVLPSVPFSQAALDRALASGKPVFVYMTADWCLTCKVNEQVAIEREATRDAFARAGVTVLKGDWTRRDPAITRFLASQGAAGIPLYLWYPGAGKPAQQLPQVLGPNALVELSGG